MTGFPKNGKPVFFYSKKQENPRELLGAMHACLDRHPTEMCVCDAVFIKFFHFSCGVSFVALWLAFYMQ